MNDFEFQALLLTCRPRSIYSLTMNDEGRIVVGMGHGDIVLYAAKVDLNNRLIEWFPAHSFIIEHTRKGCLYDNVRDIETTRPNVDFEKYQYVLGPV